MNTLSFLEMAPERRGCSVNLKRIWLCAAFSVLLPVGLHANGVVTECTEASLRGAMAGGGVVTFACDGVIILTGPITVSEDTTLDGTGRAVAVSGGGTTRVFSVTRGAEFDVLNLSVTGGRSTNGAAVFNDGGTVRLTNVTLSNNYAQGLAGEPGEAGSVALGGAIYNRGTLVLSNCKLLDNSAVGGPGGDAGVQSQPLGGGPGGLGLGGVLFNTGDATIAGCTFEGNSALGGAGGAGSDGPPSSNVRVGGKDGGFGGDGMAGAGGAVYQELGSLTVWNSTFSGNRATGGDGGRGGNGSSGPIGAGGDAGDGGFGGLGVGGAIHMTDGNVNLTNCTFGFNQTLGGTGAPGGAGAPCKSGRASGGRGGVGGNGGQAGGGALFVDFATANLLFSTLSGNSALGGVGGLGGLGAEGCFSELTGANGTNGIAGEAFGGSTAVAQDTFGSLLLRATLLNASASGSNCFGVILDGGNNLSSDDSPSFTTASSLHNIDPQLGPLANYGGPTLTFALLANSPAIDAGGNLPCPTTDQRGVARPVGAACDIGAFEYVPEPPVTLTASGGIRLRFVVAFPGAGLVVQASSDFIHWQVLGTTSADRDGVARFETARDPGTNRRFYRVVPR